MEMLLTNLSSLGANPLAWGAAALAAAKTLITVFLYMRCPIHRGLVNVTDEMAEAASDDRFNPPMSFLILVLLGIGLAIGGLYMLADTEFGGLAIVAAVAGLFLFMTEPTRLVVLRAVKAVYAATPGGGDRLSLARSELKLAYFSRMKVELGITISVFVALYFF